MSNEMLPIELKNNQLAVNKRKNKRTIQGIKRVGKVALNLGVWLFRISSSQSIKDFKSFEKLNGFNSSEKLAMMGLELLVELQAIKQQFEDKGVITERTDNGKNNVYPQIYTTKTHSGNIDTIEALEKLRFNNKNRKEII